MRCRSTSNPHPSPLHRVRPIHATALAAALLSACAWFATDVGTREASVEPVLIEGWARYYVLHATYGELVRLDANLLDGATYAVRAAPGPHLLEVSMTQTSVMNPLIFGGGRCALILDTRPGRTYKLTPPPMSVYGHFWLRPDVPGVRQERFASSIRVHMSGADEPDEDIEVPLDCGSGRHYCRTRDDCASPSWTRTDGHPLTCTYANDFPLGVCIEEAPAESK